MPRRLYCNECSPPVHFSTSSNLTRHNKTCHAVGDFQCRDCGRSFCKRKNLVKHEAECRPRHNRSSERRSRTPVRNRPRFSPRRSRPTPPRERHPRAHSVETPRRRVEADVDRVARPTSACPPAPSPASNSASPVQAAREVSPTLSTTSSKSTGKTSTPKRSSSSSRSSSVSGSDKKSQSSTPRPSAKSASSASSSSSEGSITLDSITGDTEWGKVEAWLVRNRQGLRVLKEKITIELTNPLGGKMGKINMEREYGKDN